MVLQLESINFNLDTSSATNSAMNIRRNQDFEVPLPEYTKLTANLFEYNCAAYAIAETDGQVVNIRVQLATFATASRVWEVKATGGGIMGPLDPIRVEFAPEATLATVDIPLSYRDFSRVGVHQVTWEWFYRRQGESSWQRLKNTSHRIYLVLSVPPAPWSQSYGDYRNPWGELLDECCRIAGGSKDNIWAARKMTKAINRDYNLRYDTDRGAPRYNHSSWDAWQFEMSNWIEYVLHGNVPPEPRFCPGTSEDHPDNWIVNCYDCGGALSLMTKIVGAQTEYHFHAPFGYLNYIYPIGRGLCNNPFPENHCSGEGFVTDSDATWPTRGGFGNHAYTRLNNKVFDACMKDYLSLWEKTALAILIALVILFSCGQADVSGLRDRYNGWLINMEQQAYEEYIIDTSTSQEAAAAGGSPEIESVTF